MGKGINSHPSLGLQWPLRLGWEVTAASYPCGDVLWSVRQGRSEPTALHQGEEREINQVFAWTSV